MVSTPQVNPAPGMDSIFNQMSKDNACIKSTVSTFMPFIFFPPSRRKKRKSSPILPAPNSMVSAAISKNAQPLGFPNNARVSWNVKPTEAAWQGDEKIYLSQLVRLPPVWKLKGWTQNICPVEDSNPEINGMKPESRFTYWCRLTSLGNIARVGEQLGGKEQFFTKSMVVHHQVQP